jgi:hypothetical protein
MLGRLAASVRRQWMGALALFLVLTTGGAYAAATIRTGDIVDGTIQRDDIGLNQVPPTRTDLVETARKKNKFEAKPTEIDCVRGDGPKVSVHVPSGGLLSVAARVNMTSNPDGPVFICLFVDGRRIGHILRSAGQGTGNYGTEQWTLLPHVAPGKHTVELAYWAPAGGAIGDRRIWAMVNR